MAIGFGILLLAIALLMGGWLLFILLRPSPPGFAPTSGQALVVAGQLPEYTIDARSRREWVYFDFSSGTVVSTSRDSLDWDLAFKRTDILTNGGDTNPAGASGAVDLGEIPLSEAVPPAGGYLADATDDENGVENPALHKWYSYNWTTHIVNSKGHIFAVRTATGEVVLLKFASYYCDDGSSGCVTFRYKHVQNP
ncbi:MAG: HmuY family protein [Dehalococcoidia bacterium]|nr:HmuY family protein [Dehalococcoidia bacterium]